MRYSKIILLMGLLAVGYTSSAQYTLINKVQRRVTFEGNSLMNHGAATLTSGFAIPVGIYNGRTYATALAYTCSCPEIA